VWNDIYGSRSNNRLVEIVPLDQLLLMYENDILESDGDNEFLVPKSDHSTETLENGTSDNNGLHANIENSQSDRVIIAEDPFRETIDFRVNDSNPTTYMEEVKESEKTRFDSNYNIDEMINQRSKEGFQPTVLLDEPTICAVDFGTFNHRLKDGIIRLYDFNITDHPHSFLDDPDAFMNWKKIPEFVFKADSYYMNKFNDLNDSSKQLPSLSIEINYLAREFATFHYADPLNVCYQRRTPKEYVEVGETMLLYRYDIRAAICNNYQELQASGKTKLRHRFYVTFCRLSCNENRLFGPIRFTLLSILTTLCISPYTVYLLWDHDRRYVVELKDEFILKYFWCDFGEMIMKEEYEFLKEQRDNFFKKHLYVYDHDALVCRDTHGEGKTIYIVSDKYWIYILSCLMFNLRTGQKESRNTIEERDKAFSHWKMVIGPRTPESIEAATQNRRGRPSKRPQLFSNENLDIKKPGPATRSKQSNNFCINPDI
jgi:hypothetical protein